ncbi:Neutral ceramidase 3 [Linum perenne]
MGLLSLFWVSVLFASCSRVAFSDSKYLVGLGSYDITGPAADVNMMGYAMMDQTTSGVHFRLRARSFIVAEPGKNRVVFVNLDACMASQIVTIKVLERLKARYGEDLYTEKNVAISGIHTHAGPAGYLQYVVYIVTSLGFVRQSFDALVDGIEQSIIQAHDNLRPGSIYVNKGEVMDAGVNRSPSAYLNNPAEERSKYKKADKPSFVSSFCQSNCGDVSPNVLGAFCTDTGLPCDFNHSTCGGKNELCIARGPGYPDEFESTRIIGDRQFRKAVELFKEATEELTGEIDYRHTFVDLSQLEVIVPKQGGGTETVRTCPAAMGFAFAAGTTDGPGAFDFKQGDDKGNAFWKLVGGMLKSPTADQVTCQYPKPVLLDTGEMTLPYPWAPSVLPIQILRVGQLVILTVPGEFTTMAGRRLRDAVKQVLTSNKNENLHVVIAGLTNTYASYITTFEEYQVQRYEGASTLYGPHTLSAYIQEFQKLAGAIIQDEQVEPGPQPPDLLSKQISMLTPVLMDTTPIGTHFGDCSSDVPKNATYNKGDKVTVVFWSACPRNDLMTEGTFALVEILQGKDTWVPAYDDDDFCLRFIWSRPAKLSSRSHATIEWRIPQSAAPGVYRIRHFGAAKALLGSVRHFTGSSSAFVVA